MNESWWRFGWTTNQHDRTKPFIGRWAHAWIGFGIVAASQERVSIGLAMTASMLLAFAWEWIAALVMRFYYLRWRYSPDKAAAWLPSVGDIVPWVIGALIATSYWLWFVPPAS
jgi:hypothetical protein